MIRASLFLPGQVTPAPVAVTADGSTLRINGDLVVPFGALRVDRSGFQAAGTVQLEWEEGGHHALTVQGEPSIEALCALLPSDLADAIRTSGRSAKRAQRRGVGWVIAFAIGLPLALFALREPLVGAVVGLVPSSVEAQIGDLVHAQVKPIDGGPMVEGVRAIGARLLAAAPEHPYTFRFEVVEDASVNAFAAPGGVVVVHTGLIAKARSADELAGVLAHEITHVLHRHSLRQIAVQLGLLGALQLTLGGTGAAEALGAITLQLGGLGFDRDQERDADRGGLELLRAAKLPADGLVSFFTALDGGAVPAFLSTHPAPEDRAEALRARIAEAGTWEITPLAVDWAAMQAAAK